MDLLIETNKDTMQWIGEYFKERGDAVVGHRRPYSKATAAIERIEEWWLENGEPYEFEIEAQEWNAIKSYLEIAAASGDEEAEEILEDCFDT